MATYSFATVVRLLDTCPANARSSSDIQVDTGALKLLHGGHEVLVPRPLYDGRTLTFHTQGLAMYALQIVTHLRLHVRAAAAKRALWQSEKRPVEYVAVKIRDVNSVATYILGERLMADGDALLDRALGALSAAVDAGWPGWEALGEMPLELPEGEGLLR